MGFKKHRIPFELPTELSWEAQILQD
uniref:Uncharacterized protein n=1 Tax=Rhizophora mucronata TaxID=61149 RepID=A0A2P2QW01_RHIMU